MIQLSDNQHSCVSCQRHHTKTEAPVKAPETISKLRMLKTPPDEHPKLKNFTLLTALDVTFEYKYIWRNRNVGSAAGMIERAARIISVI